MSAQLFATAAAVCPVDSSVARVCVRPCYSPPSRLVNILASARVTLSGGVLSLDAVVCSADWRGRAAYHPLRRAPPAAAGRGRVRELAPLDVLLSLTSMLWQIARLGCAAELLPVGPAPGVSPAGRHGSTSPNIYLRRRGSIRTRAAVAAAPHSAACAFCGIPSGRGDVPWTRRRRAALGRLV